MSRRKRKVTGDTAAPAGVFYGTVVGTAAMVVATAAAAPTAAALAIAAGAATAIGLPVYAIHRLLKS